MVDARPSFRPAGSVTAGSCSSCTTLATPPSASSTPVVASKLSKARPQLGALEGDEVVEPPVHLRAHEQGHWDASVKQAKLEARQAFEHFVRALAKDVAKDFARAVGYSTSGADVGERWSTDNISAGVDETLAKVGGWLRLIEALDYRGLRADLLRWSGPTPWRGERAGS